MKRSRRRAYKEGVPLWGWVVVGFLSAVVFIFREERRAPDIGMVEGDSSHSGGAEDWLPTDATLVAALRPEPALEPGTPETKAIAHAPKQRQASYMLQAGAFQSLGQAEAFKARIALLGYASRIEAAKQDGWILYRVRLGPYRTAAELIEVKNRLAEGGVQGLSICLAMSITFCRAPS